jgi:hypothetical protein
MAAMQGAFPRPVSRPSRGLRRPYCNACVAARYAQICDMALVLATKDRARARRLQRLSAAGQLRRLCPGVYTDDLVQPLESIVRSELFALCSLVAPGSIISHRSALEGGRPTAAGNLFLTGANRRDFELPGVKLRMAKGVGPLDSDIRIPTFTGDAFISSQARALLENLTSSRGNPAERRTTGAEGVEDWLARFISRDVSGATNKIRDAARGIAGSTRIGIRIKTVRQDHRRSPRNTTDPSDGAAGDCPRGGQAVRRCSCHPFPDTRRRAPRNSLHVPTADPNIDSDLQAFIETYFSNYIEGTEFGIEEAHDIVVQGRPLKYREDDSHDILGTYRAILESKASPIIPQHFEDFAKQLQDWNREVIESRQSKSPGEFKTESNVLVTPYS